MKDMELDKMNPNINAEIKRQIGKYLSTGKTMEYAVKHVAKKLGFLKDDIYPIAEIVEEIEMSTRNYCELCGAKLSKPETDLSKTAVCNKCLEKQYH